jgi:EAL domain-containing protein (putative c-di-GMP-specific phosphodiesterase class I)
MRVHQLCASLQRFHLLGFEQLSLSMNDSFQEFSQKNYVSNMARTLKEAKLTLNLFGIEIKESHLMRNPQLSYETLTHIRKLGVMLTIDEFGIGPSSLSDLPRLSVTNIKI